VKIPEAQSISDLPADVGTLKTLLWTMMCDYRSLQEQYLLLRKELFGKKSEKQIVETGEQCALDELLAEVAVQTEPPKPVDPKQDLIKVPAHERRRNHPGRNAIPEDIPVVYHRIEPSEQEMECCGGRKVELGEPEIRKVIERIPARYELHIYIRPKYVCQKCKDGVTIAEPPVVTPISKGLAGLCLLIFVITGKYQFHLPLYRIQRQIYHESLIWFTRSTMVGWIAELCVLLKRVYDEMKKEVKRSDCIHSDDSHVLRVTRGGGSHTSYMWLYIGMGGRVIVFDYQDNRGSEAPREFLKGVAPGTYLMIDGYASYNDAIKRYQLIPLACMMHIRREFVEAIDVGNQVDFARKILRFIGQLYRIERYATAKNCTAEQRYALRQQYSKPIMESIKKTLMTPEFSIIPGNRISKAITYALNHWDRASRFLDRGDLPIDNGPSERAVRDQAIGRNNWNHVGSDRGGKWMAILYSIITTCKTNGIDIAEYIKDVLMRLAIRSPEQSVSNLTPIEWWKTKNGGTLPQLKSIYPSKS
jgi:transposase